MYSNEIFGSDNAQQSLIVEHLEMWDHWKKGYKHWCFMGNLYIFQYEN